MTLNGALQGIAAIKKAVNNTNKGNQEFSGESPFLTLKDGESRKIRFIQEVDEQFSSYDARRGILLVINEHSNPSDFRKKAVCTFDADDSRARCFGCERYNRDDEVLKKWRPRMRLYANVIVRGDTGGDKVKILSQGFGDKAVGETIIDMAVEYDGICNQDFKLSRQGSSMNDTKYSLLPLAARPLSKEDLAFEVIDLTKIIKFIDYKDQAEFYGGTESLSEASKKEW